MMRRMDMNLYLVRLAGRETGESQRILVRSECQDGMQEFVETLDDLMIAHPVVIAIHRLRVERPVDAATATLRTPC